MNMWDERFAGQEFFYGTEPNAWLARHADQIAPRGRVLSLGEGEGRNGVFLATRGHKVDAVDASAVGMAKAQKLAASKGVLISTTVADLAQYAPAADAYDGLILIYLHMPPPLRRRVHAQAQAALKRGGVLILEAFTPRQLGRDSGGPKSLELLFEPDALREDFPEIAWESLAEVEIGLEEGDNHKGPAMVVRGVGHKR